MKFYFMGSQDALLLDIRLLGESSILIFLGIGSFDIG